MHFGRGAQLEQKWSTLLEHNSDLRTIFPQPTHQVESKELRGLQDDLIGDFVVGRDRQGLGGGRAGHRSARHRPEQAAILWVFRLEHLVGERWFMM